MKSVCIIGAGPAGLAAAKILHETKHFDVTVYEKKNRIGGIWALDRNSTDGFLDPKTPTNLSRFTVALSDLDWNRIELEDNQSNGLQNGDSSVHKIPMFPKAWMANRYLETYRKRYIPDSMIHCSRQVTKAHRVDQSWQVTTADSSGQDTTKMFDYLVMASGFFSRPRDISQGIPGLVVSGTQLKVKAIHSSSFRKLRDLFDSDKDVRGKTILMVGGGNSSGETAAAVAMQLSDSRWSYHHPDSNRYDGCKIVHVTARPFYALPHFHEYESGSRSFVPLDFKLYDFNKRPKDLPSYAGRQSQQVRDIVHGSLQAMVGGDQSDISEALVSAKGQEKGSAYIALTESYPEFVRSGLIEVLHGRVTAIENNSDGSAIARVYQNGKELAVDDVAAVIYATGFTPCPALELLDDTTKAAIKYDPTSMRLPAILQQWQTMSTDAPTISFLGFYEGPYWPMVEMQARLTAARWLGNAIADQKSYEADEELLRLRKEIRGGASDIPQFWFNDYLGYLEDIADVLQLKKNHGHFQEREGCISPARFLIKQTAQSDADAIMDDLYNTWQDCVVNGKYVSRAAFRALHGKWTISRRIDSAIASFPSGTLEGIATFHPRYPTEDKSGAIFDLEYLYTESGTFTLSSGHTMTASRQYVYRYSEPHDRLSVWFVKPENTLAVDYLFHNLDFIKPAEARKAGASIARADHLCVKDMYWTEYRLPMKGSALREFEVEHTVKGPHKDYVSVTKYTRPDK